MFTVYVLFSPSYKKIYVGFTSNMDERIKSHNELGKKGYTIRYRPWVIAFTEEYMTKAELLSREKSLKGGQGRKFIHEQLIVLGLISA